MQRNAANYFLHLIKSIWHSYNEEQKPSSGLFKTILHLITRSIEKSERNRISEEDLGSINKLKCERRDTTDAVKRLENLTIHIGIKKKKTFFKARANLIAIKNLYENFWDVCKLCISKSNTTQEFNKTHKNKKLGKNH